MERYLSQVLHRLCPQRLEAGGKSLGESRIPNQQRGNAPAIDKRVVHTENYNFVIDDVERVADLSGVPYSGNMLEVATMFLQKGDQSRRSPIGETKDDAMVDLSRGGVSRNPPQQRYAQSVGRVHGIDVAFLHV